MHWTKFFIRNILMVIAISGSVTTVHANPNNVHERTTNAETVALMQKAIDAVKARLKNPGSAQFRKVHLHRYSNGVPMTCGEVNSRDGLGDYGGFQKFISAGRSDITLLESQMENQGRDFSIIWNKFCN